MSAGETSELVSRSNALSSAAGGRSPRPRRARRPRTALERQLEEEASLIVHSSSTLSMEFPYDEDEVTLRISSFSKLMPDGDRAPHACLESTLLSHPLRIDLRYGAERAIVGDQLIWAATPAGTAYTMFFGLEEWAEEFITGGWTPRWVRFRRRRMRDLRPELLEEF